jgi:hypothetical protein
MTRRGQAEFGRADIDANHVAVLEHDALLLISRGSTKIKSLAVALRKPGLPSLATVKDTAFVRSIVAINLPGGALVLQPCQHQIAIASLAQDLR